MKFLTEKLLGEVLKEIFPAHTFIHDRCVPDSNSRRRPDYRCEELKLIVEFDGDKHYSTASKIKTEQEKTNMYTHMGYKVVRIPYFVQLSKEVIYELFSIETEPSYHYPHGFISD